MHRFLRHAPVLGIGVSLAWSLPTAVAAEIGAPIATLPVNGAQTCSTSGCHGGADEKSRQFVIWSQHDVHTRAYATLTTARAARMAEALKIPDATTSARCTTCHAPLQTVPAALRMEDAQISEGVSCVSCHGPSAPWLRSHTRPDFTHEDRVAAGMRELRSLYGRANACVACHQNLDSEIISVGRHPALRFELDGMSHSQPPHWREPAGRSGAQAWFVGQAVALREVSWAVAGGLLDREKEMPRLQALLWLLRSAGVQGAAEAIAPVTGEAAPAVVAQSIKVADTLARQSSSAWSAADSANALRRLAATHPEFLAADVPALAQACRAERLVVALDRLIGAAPAGSVPAEASAQLDRLFRLVQSQPDFSPKTFAMELAGLAALVAR